MKQNTNKNLTRRDLMTRAVYALGGAATLGSVQACSSSAATPATPATGPTVKDFPYEKHLPAGYQLVPAAVQEPAYNAYYEADGGCCHGAYSALMKHLAATVGAPFDQLPPDFGRFGAGGIAGYGSICGSILGGVLVIGHIVSDKTARNNMMTDLLRWYERAPFPTFTPTAKNANETTTLDFSAANIVNLQTTPGTHLCHASVSGWCAARGVAANSGDKLARCSRLTADVAAKVAEMINTYLASTTTPKTYGVAAIDSVSVKCVGCHTKISTTRPVAAGMACAPCHEDQASPTVGSTHATYMAP
jgi:putative redox-active protein with C_GCAxxG_C_C motif